MLSDAQFDGRLTTPITSTSRPLKKRGDPDTRVNEDGSIYILLGPDAPPEGWEANYVQTLPDRGWFPYFRAYGARVEFFDDSYKLPTIRRVDSFSEYVK